MIKLKAWLSWFETEKLKKINNQSTSGLDNCGFTRWLNTFILLYLVELRNSRSSIAALHWNVLNCKAKQTFYPQAQTILRMEFLYTDMNVMLYHAFSRFLNLDETWSMQEASQSIFSSREVDCLMTLFWNIKFKKFGSI